MVGWTIFGAVLGFTALAFHEERGRQILIGMLFVLVCASVTALTDYLAWGIIFGGVSTFTLSFKLYLNQMARESEAREREKYDRELEVHREQEAHFDAYWD